MTRADCNYARSHSDRVIVVNDSWQMCPDADVLYACDGAWWDHHNGVTGFCGAKWTQDQGAAKRWQLNWVRCEYRDGLSNDRRIIHGGSNSGYQAMNMAVHFGVRRIVLLGFDMKLAADGKRHWFGDHPGRMNKPSKYHVFQSAFDGAVADITAADIEVINCSRDTALTCFPRRDLERVLC